MPLLWIHFLGLRASERRYMEAASKPKDIGFLNWLWMAEQVSRCSARGVSGLTMSHHFLGLMTAGVIDQE